MWKVLLLCAMLGVVLGHGYRGYRSRHHQMDHHLSDYDDYEHYGHYGHRGHGHGHGHGSSEEDSSEEDSSEEGSEEEEGSEGGQTIVHHHYYYDQVHQHQEPAGKQPVPPSASVRGTPTPGTTPGYTPTPTPHEGDHEHHDHDHQHDDRIWTFQVGDYFGAWEYIDEEGYLKGFHIDLINAVCQQAGKHCHYLLDTYKHCWDTSGGLEYPGIGLLDGWYDACIGLFPSPERLNSFNFTTSFSPNFKAALHFRLGEVPSDPYNLTEKTIGFIDGWAVGKRCLGRQLDFSGNQVGDYIPYMYDTHEELVTALQMKEVDAILTVDAFDAEKLAKLGIVAIEPWFSCTTGGASVMARYGNPVVHWWNEAFEDLLANGQYAKLCARAKEVHGHRGRLYCLEG